MESRAVSTAHVTLRRNGVRTIAVLNEESEFILENGWAPATTRQYAAAVNKYLAFLREKSFAEKAMPCSSQQLYEFILWCSKTNNKPVLSNTTTRYLTGLRMWHALHDKPFPVVNLNRIRLLLKGCRKLELHKTTKKRIGLTLRNVVDLVDELATNSLTDLVTKGVILTGFWGLARLGELTLHRDHPGVFVRRKDLSFSMDGKSATIRLRMAKTAKPGETQLIRLRTQPNRLDPINVLHEILQRVPGDKDSPLFPGKDCRVPISRSHITNFLRANGPSEGETWSGHSLRIGGASFQRNLGRSVQSLKSLGRWKSSAYKSYMKVYPEAQLAEVRLLARRLHF